MSLSPNVIELLRALADGKQLQWRADGPEEWADCDAVAALACIGTGRAPTCGSSRSSSGLSARCRARSTARRRRGRPTSSPTWTARAVSADKSGQVPPQTAGRWSAGSSTWPLQTHTSTPTPC